MKLINKISGKITNSNKNISIELNGKNLIVAGGNGSGKTSLALATFQTINSYIVQRKAHDILRANNTIKTCTEALSSPTLSGEIRSIYQNQLNAAQVELKSLKGLIDIEYHEPLKALNSYEKKHSVFRFFAAERKAVISSVSSATASLPDIHQINSLTPGGSIGNNLEQHLVNLKVRSALALQAGEVGKRSLHAEEWIASFTNSMKYLFEDPSVDLVFLPDKLSFLISQAGKPNYSFQSLSSGYLAIFDIYASLLMHTEYVQIKPSELSGVVIIDEIDAHLHVSLQRKILPFFTKSFPAIQFIVTTHSPFVLTSVDDAVIFDITTLKTSSNLSMYSYESVIEGLLGVPPISKIFEDTITELTNITSNNDFDVRKAENLLNTISPYADVLDAESAMFYQLAANKIIKSKTESK